MDNWLHIEVCAESHPAPGMEKKKNKSALRKVVVLKYIRKKCRLKENSQEQKDTAACNKFIFARLLPDKNCISYKI
jgi:hypothetical protein